MNATTDGRGDNEAGHHDAIIARSDSLGKNFVPGYHWACAIDDADGNYRLLVRAWDLAPVDEIQSAIRGWCRPLPDQDKNAGLVFHTSIVTRDDGGRLEKRTQGVTLPELQAVGVSADDLAKKIKVSFDVDKALENLSKAERPIGEELKTISLRTLTI